MFGFSVFSLAAGSFCMHCYIHWAMSGLLPSLKAGPNCGELHWYAGHADRSCKSHSNSEWSNVLTSKLSVSHQDSKRKLLYSVSSAAKSVVSQGKVGRMPPPCSMTPFPPSTLKWQKTTILRRKGGVRIAEGAQTPILQPSLLQDCRALILPLTFWEWAKRA